MNHEGKAGTEKNQPGNFSNLRAQVEFPEASGAKGPKPLPTANTAAESKEQKSRLE